MGDALALDNLRGFVASFDHSEEDDYHQHQNVCNTKKIFARN